MNILDIIAPSQTFLAEANLVNISDPYEGFSVQKYLKHYAEGLKAPAAQKMFVKKLQKLLMNDPKYHFAVRELPADAPEWAQEALHRRDLFYFKPNEDLTRVIEHIGHYVAAMEEDMEQTADNDKKTRASKEFAGFPKAETLAVLEKASEEYFARGAKSSLDTEGMSEMFKKDGFTWWKLNTATAFKRAGDTLQNCIGKYYTKASCDRDGYSIVVLADRKGSLLVASRIGNDKHELLEMKGKNNKPPIKQYMPPVAALINKFKLKVTSDAHRDITNTGYFYDDVDNILLTKPQAMKKLVTYEQLDKLGMGLTLVHPKAKNDSEAARRIYNELYSIGGGYRSNVDQYKVFEARAETGNPIITAFIKNGVVEKLNTFFNARLHDEAHLQEAVDESKKKEYFKLFINAIAKRGGVRGFDTEVIRHVFWEMGLEWDSADKKLIDKPHGADVQHNKKLLKWEKFVDASTINSIKATLELKHGSRIGTLKRAYVATEETADDRSRLDDDMHLVVLVDEDKDSYMTNISGSLVHEDHVGYKKDLQSGYQKKNMIRSSLDQKTIDSIVKLAKHEDFHLPDAARARFGVAGDKPENYKQIKAEWKKIPGDPEAIKADFSHLRDEDRFPAVYSTLMLELGGLAAKDLFGIHKSMAAKKDREYFSTFDTHNVNHGNHWDGHTPASAQKAIGNIDTIWKVDVGYGAQQKHGVMMMSSGTKIMKVDSQTEEHRWQGWDDFDEVAKTLNKFAENHKLTFANGSVTTDKRASTEFREEGGKLVTAANQKASELSRQKHKEGTDQITFHNDWTLTRMSPEEQGKWIRQGVKDGVRGKAWLLEDDKKNKRMVLTVLHQRIARLFFHWQSKEVSKDWPTSSGSKKMEFVPYIKQAMKQFDWKPAKTGTLKPKAINADVARLLDRVGDKYTVGSNNYLFHNDFGYARWTLDQFAGSGWIERSTRTKPGTQRQQGAYQISQQGIDLLATKKEVGKWEDVNDESGAKAADTHPDWKMPEKEVRQPAARAAGGAARPARAPRAAGAETKASLALTKFADHVEEHGQIPTRGEFIAYMEADPFNMTKTGAQTYYYTTKKKNAALNECVIGDLAKLLLLEPDGSFNSFSDFTFE